MERAVRPECERVVNETVTTGRELLREASCRKKRVEQVAYSPVLFRRRCIFVETLILDQSKIVGQWKIVCPIGFEVETSRNV